MPIMNQAAGASWTMLHGDCCEAVNELPDNSMDYSIHSPPFASLFVYSDHPADMGNCKNDAEFFEHYKYLIPQLLRVTVPGRLCSVHSMQMPTTKKRDGFIGIRDFPGDIVRAFQAAGWIYHSRVVIFKDPLVAASRTKALGLAHKQIVKNSARCRQGIADYLDTFIKPTTEWPKPVDHHAKTAGFDTFIGENPPQGQHRTNNPRTNKHSHAIWRRYASPIWTDIDQMRTLNVRVARDASDEVHLCPLQLDVIDRCVDMWTNPGDVVFSPFAGVGSEGYGSILAGRKFLGVELKESYFVQAVKNLTLAATEYRNRNRTLFDLEGDEDASHESHHGSHGETADGLAEATSEPAGEQADEPAESVCDF